MLKGNRNLIIIALIATVNALGYGIVIPVLYNYSLKYGLSVFDNGMLFAVFSLCAFISTPIIGRLSDMYGRKPLLIISVAGTALSFVFTAIAPNAFVLFLARALDGITAGNIPVASAVISDTLKPEDRPKGFGVITAAFNFGFVFGPALSGFTSVYSLEMPFIVAAIITFVAVFITWIYLPETNKHIGEVHGGKLFDFRKLYHMLFDSVVGKIFLITLIYGLSFALLIYAFQPFLVNKLNMPVQQVALTFSLFGLLGVIAQYFIVDKVTKNFGIKQALTWSLVAISISYFVQFLSSTFAVYVIGLAILALANALIMPLTSALLSRAADAKSQGTIMGLNMSYISLANIFGPILGGAAATISISYPFLLAAVVTLICVWLSTSLVTNFTHKEHAF